MSTSASARVLAIDVATLPRYHVMITMLRGEEKQGGNQKTTKFYTFLNPLEKRFFRFTPVPYFFSFPAFPPIRFAGDGVWLSKFPFFVGSCLHLRYSLHDTILYLLCFSLSLSLSLSPFGFFF